ncbi:MBL fold metallo-hydrolase [Gammaproteobacteria bacterium]|nr:MBL fold metallo-hydrolase [Gammaproteobacteria bacterium]
MVKENKVNIKFNREFDCEHGVMVQVSPMVRRIVANNPGPFTFKGTGTYIIGHGKVAVIDPGPRDEKHVEAMMVALDGEEITHQLVTHTHNDHSPAAKLIKARTGAKTYGFGPHGSGKYGKGFAVEAGGDTDFIPDIALLDGDVIKGENWTINCIHTPGHTSNHLCFHLDQENALFPGDHVMGWSTTVVSPPDGDVFEYMNSLRKLAERSDRIYYPTHGAPIKSPQRFVRAILVHRKMRESQILDCLDKEIYTIPFMVEQMYKDLDERLIGAAQQSIFAHIIDLSNRGIIKPQDEISIDSEFYRI